MSAVACSQQSASRGVILHTSFAKQQLDKNGQQPTQFLRFVYIEDVYLPKDYLHQHTFAAAYGRPQLSNTPLRRPTAPPLKRKLAIPRHFFHQSNENLSVFPHIILLRCVGRGRTYSSQFEQLIVGLFTVPLMLPCAALVKLLLPK